MKFFNRNIINTVAVAFCFGGGVVVKAEDDWRNILDGVDGYPAGNMLEIAVRRTQPDKEEMFKWRSEFISMLSVQPGPLVEREWKSLSSWPPLTGAGTWTGMTWWENQQAWHNMANMIFPSPVTANWLATINMTLCFARPDDPEFDLRTLAQSGGQVLELGIMAYPTSNQNFQSALDAYLAVLNDNGSTGTYQFSLFSNGAINGPFTTTYNANGPPNTDGTESWKVYMAEWKTLADYEMQIDASKSLLDAVKAESTEEHSSIDIATRSTSLVCCKPENQCVLDPEECNVGVLGGGDTWASNCGQCPSPCKTGYGICSMLSSKTCLDIGGTLASSCSEEVVGTMDVEDPSNEPSGSSGRMDAMGIMGYFVGAAFLFMSW